jgi:hypothetical protein
MSEAADRPDKPQGPKDPWGPDEPWDAAWSLGERRPGNGNHTAAPVAPEHAPRADADAWATACAEDLAAERARRRGRQSQPGSAAEELRRLLDTVADRLSGLSGGAAPLIGTAAQGAAQQVVQQMLRQAKAAVEPVIERNPGLFDHLAAAGSELLAAYRSAVSAQEQRWTRDAPPASDARPAPPDRLTKDGPSEPDPKDRGDHPGPPDHRGHGERGDRPDDGPSGGERIDLD